MICNLPDYFVVLKKCIMQTQIWFFRWFLVLYKSYSRKILLHRYFSKTLPRCQEHRCGTPLNGCFQNSLPGISNVLLRFSLSLYFCARETTHSKDILLSDIPLSILHFLNFIWFYHFYSPKSKLFFLFLYFLKFAIHFVLNTCGMFISNFWLVKNTCSIIFQEKLHMINQKSRALSDFLKIICD